MLEQLIARVTAMLPRSRRPASARKIRRAVLKLERLEDRFCPAGQWQWVGPQGGDGLWSNPNGQNWELNNVLQAAGQYPGMPNSQNDVVYFSTLAAGPATLDVAVNPLQGLSLSDWSKTLTLNYDLKVTGAGTFLLVDGSTIQLGSHMVNGINQISSLSLVDLAGSNTWTGTGSSIDGPPGSNFNVEGSGLEITGSTLNLGANLSIQGTESGNSGYVDMKQMPPSSNLTLSGSSNEIFVGNNGILNLNQVIATQGDENTEGGILFGEGHTGLQSIQINSGGTVNRGGTPLQGILDQISVSGAIINSGGKLEVWAGTMLKITGEFSNGNSYLQNKTSPNLQIDAGGNLSAAGAYEIDQGSVKIYTPNTGQADELDGTALYFEDGGATTFTIQPSTSQMATVIIQGAVTLAEDTTTTMWCLGGPNTAEQLIVDNGPFVLSGTLKVNIQDKKIPTQPLGFFTNAGHNYGMSGSMTISDNLGDNHDSGQIQTTIIGENGAQADVYEVTFAA